MRHKNKSKKRRKHLFQSIWSFKKSFKRDYLDRLEFKKKKYLLFK